MCVCGEEIYVLLNIFCGLFGAFVGATLVK